jgi:hypothetical protein
MKSDEKALIDLFRSRQDWTFRTFAQAVARKTGKPCSSGQGFKLLQRFRASGINATKLKAAAKVNNAWMEELAASVAKAGVAVKKMAKPEPRGKTRA